MLTYEATSLLSCVLIEIAYAVKTARPAWRTKETRKCGISEVQHCIGNMRHMHQVECCDVVPCLSCWSGNKMYDQKMYSRAVESYSQALQLDPKNGPLLALNIDQSSHSRHGSACYKSVAYTTCCIYSGCSVHARQRVPDARAVVGCIARLRTSSCLQQH